MGILIAFIVILIILSLIIGYWYIMLSIVAVGVIIWAIGKAIKKHNWDKASTGPFNNPYNQPKAQNPVIKNEADLKVFNAQLMAPQWIKISNDCSRLVQETTNPEIFFWRLSQWEKTLINMAGIENIVSFTGAQPSTALRLFYIEKWEVIDNFIKRYYDATLRDIERLKTQSAKERRIENFKTSMEEYRSELNASNEELCDMLYSELCESNILGESKASDKSLSLVHTSENQEWEISVSFGKSTSKSFSQAVYLAKAARKYEEYEHDGKMVYQAWFSAEKDEYLNFIRLYEFVANWKSSAAMINGELIDRKIIGGINYCYGDKCRNGRSDFCFGASAFTKNPFGCHRLQISTYNNPWWTFGHWSGNTFYVDKDSIRARIDEYSTAYRVCPDFNYAAIINRLSMLPNTIIRPNYEALVMKERNVVSLTFDIEVPKQIN